MRNKLLKKLMLSVLILIGSVMYGQTVTGVVSDDSGALPGVSVIVKGTSVGIETDFDGKYTLEAKQGDVLVFSSLGYKTVEKTVNSNVINVTLAEDATQLSEVVVIGYGTTTVKDATGSVASVKAEDFNGGVISSPEQLIQGKTAGVQISSSSGEPGAGITVSIRGSNSLRANNNPLFVVDGVPLLGDDVSPTGETGSGGSSGRNPLNFLNPKDIESISVLKDASATAIYGSRGSNGVVIITTKSGKGGEGGKWEFSSSVSVGSIADKFDLLNKDQFLDAVGQAGGNVTETNKGFNTDWQDFIFRGTTSTNNSLAYSNNYGKGNVRATLSYGDQEGIVEKSDLERLTGRINLKHKFFDDKLTIRASGTLSKIDDETAPLSGGAGFRGDVLGAAYTANPTWSTSTTFSDLDGLVSPANYLANSQIKTETNRFLANLSAEYEISDNFTTKVNFGYDDSKGENLSMLSSDLLNFNGISGLGNGSYNTLNRKSNLFEVTLNYNKAFEHSNLDLLGGFSYQDFQTNGTNVSGRIFNVNDLNQMEDALIQSTNLARSQISGSYRQFYYAPNLTGLHVNRILPTLISNEVVNFDQTAPAVSSLVGDVFKNTDEIQSFFIRTNFSLKDKYLFTGTVRVDGSSRFGSNNKYGVFPSGAFAWKLHEEDFIGDVFSTLKMRLGAGVTGNQDGLGHGDYFFTQGFNSLTIQDNGDVNPNGSTVLSLENPDLKWEPTLNLNFGIDYGFLDNRLTGAIDFYRNNTSDVLLSIPTITPAILASQFQNIDMNLINQGVEFSIDYQWLKTEDVSFSSAFNIAYNDNVIENYKESPQDYGEINGPGLSGPPSQRLADGVSIYSYYMAIFDGFDSNGEATYRDVDGNGVGDPDVDKTFTGEDALPDITTGLSLNLNVKNWDLSAYLTGQFGFSVYNNTALAYFVSPSLNNARNVTTDVLTGAEPIPSNNSTAVSTRFLEKGDFIRMQNASLGYNFPLKDSDFFKSMRLSVTGQNLFLITDYNGLDPEVSVQTGNLGTGIPARGIDWLAFPRPRTFTFGFNATF